MESFISKMFAMLQFLISANKPKFFIIVQFFRHFVEKVNLKTYFSILTQSSKITYILHTPIRLTQLFRFEMSILQFGNTCRSGKDPTGLK